MKRFAIKLYANEDGLGPAMGIYYVVLGLVKAFAKSACLDICVQSSRVFITQYCYAALLGERYKRDLQSDGGEHTFRKDNIAITVVRRSNRFALVKDERGGVAKERTRQALKVWLEGLDNYVSEEKAKLQEFFSRAQADHRTVVSFGVPAALKAAKDLADTEGTPIQRIEVFDHAWGYTLSRIFEKEMKEVPEIGAAVERMEELEAYAEKVFLFPEYVCPSQYFTYWLGHVREVYRIPGVFGGMPEKFRQRAADGKPEGVTVDLDQARLKDIVLAEATERAALELGEFLAPDYVNRLTENRSSIRSEARTWLTAQMKTWDREFFGCDKDFILAYIQNLHVVVVQGGATSVWNTYMARLIDALVQAEQNDALRYCVLLAHNPAIEAYGEYCLARNPSLRETQPGRNEREIAERVGENALREKLRDSTHIRTLPDHHFPLFQEVYWAADMIYSRGGGITANDATATLTPLTIVEEVGQWQTEQIRELYRLTRFHTR